MTVRVGKLQDNIIVQVTICPSLEWAQRMFVGVWVAVEDEVAEGWIFRDGEFLAPEQ